MPLVLSWAWAFVICIGIERSGGFPSSRPVGRKAPLTASISSRDELGSSANEDRGRNRAKSASISANLDNGLGSSFFPAGIAPIGISCFPCRCDNHGAFSAKFATCLKSTD